MLLEIVKNGFEEISYNSVLLAILVVLFIAVYYYGEAKNALPGPTGLPILGYWPFLDRNATHIQLGKLKEKYGDVFGINVAGQLYVNLGTAKAVREAHITKSDCFSDRSHEYSILTCIFGDSMVFTHGDKWHTLRKFFLNLFKERGMTSIKTTLDVPMADAMMGIIEDLKQTKGEPVSIINVLRNRCDRLFQESLFGNSQVSISDIKTINNHYENVSNSFSPYNILLSGLLAKYILLPLTTNINSALKSKQAVIDIVSKIVNDEKARLDESESIVGAFYKEKEERKRKGDPTYEYFTDETIKATLLQFIGDGALSAAIFVSIFFKALLENPEEQDKIYQELEDVVGPNRQPTIEDKVRMTYTNCFLNEVLRTNDFFAFFPSLLCTKETTLGGYTIPKGSITLVNMWSAHNDPNTYENAEKFDPSRFLPTEGKRKAELPITFGVGKRACLGEGFVMIQAFLFLTTLIKNFRLVQAYNKKYKSSFELLRSKEFNICAVPR